MISSVVLATGRADRTSEQELLMPLRGKPVLQRVLESALASDLHEIVCVVRDLEAVRRRISLVDERLYWLTNPAADQGQSTSVIAGLWAIDPKSDGVTGDSNRIRERFSADVLRKRCELRFHLGARAEREVVLVHREPFLVMDGVAGLHGEEDVVGARIVGRAVV